MLKNVFKPFWSYNVQKTEQWLAAMAMKGYLLQKITSTSIFIFTVAEPRNRTYFISYEKRQGDFLSLSMQNDGWNKIFGCGKWLVLANEKPVEHIATYPLRDHLLARNRAIMYVFGFFAAMHFMLFFVRIFFQLLFSNQPVTLQPSPFWIITVMVYTWVYYSFITIYLANKRLLEQYSTPSNLTSNFSPENTGEQLLHPGKTVIKIRLAWNYAPDKLEQWLEKMEKQGYNLYRTRWSGTLYYFVQGKPRNVKYCADFQYKTDQSYFDIHQDAGWKIVFTRGIAFDRWTLWSREYAEGEAPQLYSNTSDLLKNARRLALTYSAIFIPMIILYGVQINAHINLALNRFVTMNWTLLILYSIIIIEFGFFTLRTWLYYRRLITQVNNHRNI